jgi:hypothetical protein
MKSVTIGLAVVLLARSLLLAQTATVHFAIDPTGPAKPISRYIYGVNQFHLFFDGMDGPWSHLAFTRLGGDRFTAYNWINNASQAGKDYRFQNDAYLVLGDAYKGLGEVPGGALIPVIELARAHDAACLLTVPINGYVAADKKGDGDVRNTPDYLNVRFRREQPLKGAPFSLTPDPDNSVVYQDEFVNWVKTKYPDAQNDPVHPIWFSLDNEPDWWHTTHPEIHPKKITYAELIDKTVAYAAAIKSVEPDALVFGPANYGWQGYVRLDNAPDANDRDFQEVYLRAMADAEKAHGHRLLDVLDVHWYPEATGGGIRIDKDQNIPALLDARMQAPRSLWDPSFVETSWITKVSIPGQAIQLIPRLLNKISRNYPGTKLAITEYCFSGGGDISGGIAQSDALGVFGREGLFAAALWSPSNVPFIAGAFEMFRNFDGKNGSFGDLSVPATTDDLAGTSIYASLDSADSTRMVVVAINKTGHPIRAVISLGGSERWKEATVWQLTGASPNPMPAGQVRITNQGGGAVYDMPPGSVSTIVFTPNP